MIGEINFRGRASNGQHEWLYGDLVQDDGLCYIAWFDSEAGRRVTRMVDKWSVGQYTGLKDKNGRKIYEGDIVETEFGYLVVSYLKDRYVLQNPSSDTSWVSKLGIWHDAVEVIGNIYQNPELIENAQQGSQEDSESQK